MHFAPFATLQTSKPAPLGEIQIYKRYRQKSLYNFYNSYSEAKISPSGQLVNAQFMNHFTVLYYSKE
jgi:hypothetical protein